jgi:hypothetical protein
VLLDRNGDTPGGREQLKRAITLRATNPYP